MAASTGTRTHTSTLEKCDSSSCLTPPSLIISVVNERGILPYRIPNKGVPIKVGLINSHFQPVSDTHRIEADPKQPVIDATGKSNFLVTITAKDKADVCAASVPLQIVFETKFQVQFDESSAHHQGGNHHQQQQQQNQQAASSAKKAGGKATSSASQAASKAGASTELLELNVVSQSITCIKPGSKEPEFGHLPPTPDDCVKTVYKVLGQKVLCCEGQQLVDDIMPGLAHTVWDAGILLSLYIEHELARRPVGGLPHESILPTHMWFSPVAIAASSFKPHYLCADVGDSPSGRSKRKSGD
jgi:hypothetical protein